MAKISPFRAALPDLSDIISFDDFFGSAKRKFPLYLSDGIYNQNENKSLYIYRVKRPHRSHTGILACTNVLDYINGEIKKHENTLAAKEAKMMRLFQERQALIKPILLTYPNVLKIDALVNRITTSSAPSFHIPFQDEEHIFWQIEDPNRIEALIDAFAAHVKESYICDGHHRARTSELLYKKYLETNELSSEKAQFNYMLVAYFPASEIEIHNYNRVIADLTDISDKVFIQKLQEYYTLTPVAKSYNPISQYEMGMYLDKQWYKLQLKEKYYPQAGIPTKETLDVYFLNKFVLEGILNIEDIRTEPDIKYVEGPKGAFSLERRVREGKAKVGFNLYPVALEDLITISDEQDTLPPKSTWIEPRMRNGFIAHLYNEVK
ncbi:DUF1015 family protein [Aureispira anguillae]|uniref:DUF1015 family protein n=1 Tax=Aureispira anguillae TaxID=2864201 RepID=A0A915YKL5_9BACT|nr:DUF1015 family protein [Aureispira anguillae]BDS14938.1 DUF1015 family protein [Aureispira anguillae]